MIDQKNKCARIAEAARIVSRETPRADPVLTGDVLVLMMDAVRAGANRIDIMRKYGIGYNQANEVVTRARQR